MTWSHDARTSKKLKIITIFELNNLQNHVLIQKKYNFLAHLQAEMSESSLVTSWHDVITSRHPINKSNNIFELSDLKTLKQERISFVAHLQAKIGESSLVTPWHYVMTLRHHTNEKINNISELSDSKNHGNKKINFLARLQAEICSQFCHFMTSRRNAMTSHIVTFV